MIDNYEQSRKSSAPTDSSCPIVQPRMRMTKGVLSTYGFPSLPRTTPGGYCLAGAGAGSVSAGLTAPAEPGLTGLAYITPVDMLRGSCVILRGQRVRWTTRIGFVRHAVASVAKLEIGFDKVEDGRRMSVQNCRQKMEVCHHGPINLPKWGY